MPEIEVSVTLFKANITVKTPAERAFYFVVEVVLSEKDETATIDPSIEAIGPSADPDNVGGAQCIPKKEKEKKWA